MLYGKSAVEAAQDSRIVRVNERDLKLPRFSGHLRRGDNVVEGGVQDGKKTTYIH